MPIEDEHDLLTPEGRAAFLSRYPHPAGFIGLKKMYEALAALDEKDRLLAEMAREMARVERIVNDLAEIAYRESVDDARMLIARDWLRSRRVL